MTNAQKKRATRRKAKAKLKRALADHAASAVNRIAVSEDSEEEARESTKNTVRES